MINRLFVSIVFILFSYTSFSQEESNSTSWPREVDTENGAVITLYQPQLESFKGDILIGRMAVSVKNKKNELVFGALWFSATLITDMDRRMVVLDGFDITRTHFADADAEKVDHFARMLEKEIEGWGFEMSLDNLLASLEQAEIQQAKSDNLDNSPPKIFFRTEPAILVYIDGDPIMKDSEESNIKYVVNTPYFVVEDTKNNHYYFKAFDWWYTSNNLTSDWENTKKVPSKVKKLADKIINENQSEQDSVMSTLKIAPEVIVSTVPSELISTDGEPEYVPVEGTSLLYVDNSENDIIMDINSQKYYILLAGRWYISSGLDKNDWVFCEPDKLPKEFSKIPTESPMSSVRTSVPGTEEAEIAVLEQTIPQTATVDRKTATVEVKYDGEPEFKAIEGTDMSYAINTESSVLQIDNKYYCVNDGIWFESSSAKGPWAVSIERPEEVDNIPAESPVYNVKYVYIYDHTPDVVYVGYTPGYTCSYVYGGVVVYGTGYWYRPWYRHYYYPRYPTWGFGVHYNPWTGWGFSVSISFGRHYPRYGWGPMGYHHGYRRGYSHGYRHGYNRGYAHGAARGYRAGQASANRNVYSNRSNGVKTTGINRNQMDRSNVSNRSQNINRQNQAANRSNTATRQSRPSSKENNVFTDKNGNVQRRDQNGQWQNRSNGQWQQQSGNRSTQNKQQMNRDHNARQQGAQRQNNYNRSVNQNRSAGSRPQGAQRGGGRRR